MVAVVDEVQVADLVDLDRGEDGACAAGPVQCFPSLAVDRSTWAEPAVEVAHPAVRCRRWCRDAAAPGQKLAYLDRVADPDALLGTVGPLVCWVSTRARSTGSPARAKLTPAGVVGSQRRHYRSFRSCGSSSASAARAGLLTRAEKRVVLLGTPARPGTVARSARIVGEPDRVPASRFPRRSRRLRDAPGRPTHPESFSCPSGDSRGPSVTPRARIGGGVGGRPGRRRE